MLTLRHIAVGWAVVLVMWAMVVLVFSPPSFLLASPMDVASYMSDNGATLALATVMSGTQALAGWIIACAAGIAAGAAVHYSRWMRYVGLPVVIAIQTTPIIAIVPLVTLWLGFGWGAKSAVAGLVATLPVILATFAGMRVAPPNHERIFRVAGSSEMTTFFHLRLPTAVQTIVPALRSAVVLAVVGSLVAEFLGGSTGLGFLIIRAVSRGQSSLLISAVLLASMLGQALLLALDTAISQTLSRWTAGTAALDHEY